MFEYMEQLGAYDTAGNSGEEDLVRQIGILSSENEFPLSEEKTEIKSEAEHDPVSADG
jgi:hypothetical protein